jgi:hypothetical protein
VGDGLDGNEGETEDEDSPAKVGVVVTPAEPGTAVPHAPKRESKTPATTAVAAPPRAFDRLWDPIAPPATSLFFHTRR